MGVGGLLAYHSPSEQAECTPMAFSRGEEAEEAGGTSGTGTREAAIPAIVLGHQAEKMAAIRRPKTGPTTTKEMAIEKTATAVGATQAEVVEEGNAAGAQASPSTLFLHNVCSHFWQECGPVA